MRWDNSRRIFATVAASDMAMVLKRAILRTAQLSNSGRGSLSMGWSPSFPATASRPTRFYSVNFAQRPSFPQVSPCVARITCNVLRNSEDAAVVVVSEPDRAIAKTDRITAAAKPLRELITGDAQACEGNSDDARPDGTCSVADIPTATGNVGGNQADESLALHVDLADGAIALIERPKHAAAGSEKTRFCTGRNAGNDFSRASVHRNDGIGCAAGDPHHPIAVQRIEGARRNGNGLP